MERGGEWDSVVPSAGGGGRGKRPTEVSVSLGTKQDFIEDLRLSEF